MNDFTETSRRWSAMNAVVYVVLVGVSFCLTSCSGTEISKAFGRKEQPMEKETQWRLSHECSQAAERYWNRSGYRKVTSPELLGHGYTSHYSREMQRCLIRVDSGMWAEHGEMGRTEIIYDAVERAKIASRSFTTRDVFSRPKREVTIENSLSDKPELPDTSENHRWFDQLMQK